MLSKEQIKHIAQLARLELEDKEIESLKKELSSILDYVEKLKEVDISGVEPTSHPFLLKNVMREDEVEEFKNKKGLFQAAPELKEGYFKVKKIL
ncbi:MAG TPA: Asp-tRNA(Asn)/Glu-tRNA(Gln) amidotransferase subunit GatC [Candidatus Parcubacteria bacterium]|nr:Asp-tRNA(Asn)/Glu-tRNA(Gln) amidotransferase subunit GatC [Candidatus Parcubacteria bacterium]